MTRALIVEDSIFIRQLLKENLLELNMEVVGETSTPNEGLELFLQEQPDIMLIDFSLQNMNGKELAEEILKKDIHARIILMLPYRMIEKTQELIAMGIRAVVTKPFYPEQLQTVLIEVAEDI